MLKKSKHHKARSGAPSGTFEKKPPRGGEGGFHWIYGVHAVKAALDNPTRKIRTIWATASFAQDHPFLQAFKQKLTVVEGRDFQKILPEDVVHQGIAAHVSPVDTQDISAIEIAPATAPLFLALDQICDPHNMGAIMRSACAFGVAGIILVPRHSPPLEGTVAKVASGALEHIAIYTTSNLVQGLKELQRKGVWCYGLDERGTDISQEKIDGPACLVVGAEGSGMRRLTKDTCDALVAIPTGEFSTLNASNAAAVSLYAFAQSRKDILV